jgi:hypothetical protein
MSAPLNCLKCFQPVGGVARVVEHLLSKWEAMSSNSSTDKKKKVSSQVWWYITVIPAIWEAKARRSQIQGHFRQRLARPYISKRK